MTVDTDYALEHTSPMSEQQISELASVAADSIGDQLVDMLVNAEIAGFHEGRNWDTTLTEVEDGALVVYLVRLNEDARTRTDGERVLRIAVSEVTQ